MKRVIAWALVLILCLGLFAGCKKKQKVEPDNGGVNIVDTADLEAALEYVKTVYRKVSETTPADYKRIAAVPVNGVTYEVVWTTNAPEDAVKIVKGENNMVTIDVNEESKEEVPYTLTATVSDDYGNSVSHDWKHILPAGMSTEDMIEIVKAAYALANGESMGFDVTLRGKITMINTPWSDDYQNITVTMVVEGAEDMPIQCYRLKGDGAKDLKIGDIITVTGELKNYNGTIEFVAGCTLDAVVKGEEVKAPEDPKQIVDEAYALGANQSLPYEATLTGVITQVNTPYNAQYGNVTVTIKVEGRESKPIQCYRLKGKGADQIGVNDIITVKGYITNYVGSKGYSTIQFTAGCELVSWEDRESPKQPSDPKTVVDQAYALGANETLLYEATLTGRITKVNTAYDPSYGNISVTFVVEGREDKPILCYRMKGNGVDKISIGDIITVKGYITNYVGDKGYSTIEYNYPELLSYTKNTTVAPTDSLEIVKAAYALKPGEQLPYEATVTGKITKVNTAYDASYGNVTVTIVVPGAEDMPIKCYRMKGTGADQISVGDTITVKGFIENYKHTSGDTEVEFTQGCQLVSYTKNTVTAPTDSLEIVKAAYALKPGEQLPYQATVTGTITEINTPYDSGYQNVTVTIVVPGAEDMPIKCYRLKGTGADQIKVGDTITVKGYIENYVHSSGDSEVEFTAGCMLMAWPGGTNEETPTVPEAPSSSALSSGDQVVIFAPAYNKALSANKVDETSFYNKGVDVTVSGDTVSGYGDAEIWTVTDNGDGTYSFANGGQNIGLGEQFSSMNLGETHDDWQVISLGGPLYNVKNVGRGNFIEWYASKDNWSTYNSNRAATDDQFQLSFYVIGTGILSEGTAPETPSEPTEPTVPSEPEPGEPGKELEMVTAPVAGTAYKMYMSKNGTNLFFNGATESASITYRLATSTKASEAVDVYLENVSGGYALYFMNGNTKTYIRIYERTKSDGKLGGSLEMVTTKPAEVLTYNSAFNTLVYTATTGNSYYMGTYSTYTTFSISNLSYVNEGNLDVSQFPAHFGLVSVTDEPTQPTTPAPTQPTTPAPTQPTTPAPTQPTTPAPTEPAPTEPVGPEAPVAGTAYKMYMNKTSDGKILYFNGETESETVNYRLATTEDTAAAVDVFVEEVTGGYALYFMNGSTKTYIRIYERDAAAGKGSLELVTETPAEALTYDETFKTFIYTGESGKSYYMGTYNTFTTFSVSNTSYLNEGNLDVSQFPAHFTTGNVDIEPSEPTEPTDPENPIVPEAPEAGVAYHMFMNKTSDGKVLFFNGQTESETVNYRLATTENNLEAVEVFLEETNGGYHLYFLDGAGAKTYIRIYERDAAAGKGSLELVAEAPAEVLVYNATFDTLIYTGESGNSYYMGTYNTFTTFSVSNTSYLNEGNLDVSQFPAHLVVTGTSGDDTGSGDVEIGKAYKLFMNKTSDGKILYFNGQTESASVTYRLATTENLAEAVDVYCEEANGGYYLYFMNGSAKTYIRVYERDAAAGKGSLELVTEAPAEVLTYDETFKTFIHTGESGKSYYMGTYNTFTTFSVSNTSYLNEGNLDVSQFPAHLSVETAGGNTQPTTPPATSEPTTPPATSEPTTPPATSEPTTPPAGEAGTYTKIEKIADLTAGKYLIAAYAEAYEGNDFSANPWHFWDGVITTGTNNDLVTNTYAYADGALTKFEGTANVSKNGDAVEIELIAVEGKANTYYVKVGDQYLNSNGAAKRKLQLTATPGEWVAEDNANGGIVLHQYFGSDFTSMGYANAASNMIRGYKSSSGKMNTGIKAGLYFFAEN